MVRAVSRCFWLACLLLLLTRPVSAAELHWDAPEGCPDVHALEHESEQQLGEPLANYALEVEGNVREEAAQLTLSLRITLPAQAETRERSLHAASCQELLEAAAIAIALAAAESGENPQGVAVQQNTEPREPPPRAAKPEPAEVSEPMRLELGAAGTAAIGALPHPGFGGELQLAWMHGWLRLGLAATWFPERSMQLTANQRATFGMYFAELLLCGQAELASARLFACATGALGRIGAHLDGPATPRTETTAWRTLGIRVGISYPILPPLELTAALAVAAPFTRPHFYMEPTASVILHEPAAVTAALLLGAVFSI
jgi:hypothetical protein